MKSIQFLKTSFFILLLIIVVNTIQTYTIYQTKKYGSIDFFNISDHIFGVLICIISFVCTYLSWLLISRKYTQKIIKIGFTFILALFLFAFAISLFYVGYRYFIHGLATSLNMVIGNFVYSLTMNHLYISGYAIAYLHLQHSKELALSIERLEREKEVFKSKILQKNLEPHFLFNNLSILSSLAQNSPNEVEPFIDAFSDAYRYYLKHNHHEIVPLKEELLFLSSYTDLIKKRFNNSYVINNNIADESGFIIPCSLQLCIENAIKHNYGSDENPLRIDLELNNDTIIIKNNLNEIEVKNSSKIGNQYLKNQYLMLFDKEIEFFKTEKEYVVKIPIIK
jgi:two-component system LytT family sensor kinase